MFAPTLVADRGVSAPPVCSSLFSSLSPIPARLLFVPSAIDINALDDKLMVYKILGLGLGKKGSTLCPSDFMGATRVRSSYSELPPC